MAEPAYLAVALASAVAITVTLRALPFAVKGAMADSELIQAVGRWMPLGAVTILAVYCLVAIDLSVPAQAVPELAGVAVTVAVHGWRRNAVLSIVAGSATCIALANGLLA
jgi:branched-subunit amino acid transport protein AzlD